jgi:hypothetical protein
MSPGSEEPGQPKLPSRLSKMVVFTVSVAYFCHSSRIPPTIIIILPRCPEGVVVIRIMNDTAHSVPPPHLRIPCTWHGMSASGIHRTKPDPPPFSILAKKTQHALGKPSQNRFLRPRLGCLVPWLTRSRNRSQLFAASSCYILRNERVIAKRGTLVLRCS